jgi:serine/threonine-protein kinase RsbW
VGAVRIPHEPASAGLVRHQLATELRQYGVVPECIDEVILVASELVGNAIRHAPSGGSLEVNWQVEPDGVLVSVADAGGGWPARRAAGRNEPDGRGLSIVDALSSEWGVANTDGNGPLDGKQVWARVPVRRIDRS